jgi:hypothetical protein
MQLEGFIIPKVFSPIDRHVDKSTFLKYASKDAFEKLQKDLAQLEPKFFEDQRELYRMMASLGIGSKKKWFLDWDEMERATSFLDGMRFNFPCKHWEETFIQRYFKIEDQVDGPVLVFTYGGLQVRTPIYLGESSFVNNLTQGNIDRSTFDMLWVVLNRKQHWTYKGEVLDNIKYTNHIIVSPTWTNPTSCKISFWNDCHDGGEYLLQLAIWNKNANKSL